VVDPLAVNSHQQLAGSSSWSSLVNCGGGVGTGNGNDLHNLNIPVSYLNQSNDLNTAATLAVQHQQQQQSLYPKSLIGNELGGGLVMTSNVSTNGSAANLGAGLNPIVSSLSSSAGSSSLSASSSSSSSLSNVNDSTQDQTNTTDLTTSNSSNANTSLKVCSDYF
jgi:hypothetical protein